ncbi:MAG: hypothetical protein GX638_15845 [Crenarchaeota archaeon]|nr:hypothetical protein [Thermoproteota archaeon]
MQTTVASLLLVVSAVVLTCLVIDYTVNVVEATLNTDNIPAIAQLRNLQNNILNQTNYLINQTIPESNSTMQVTPTP